MLQPMFPSRFDPVIAKLNKEIGHITCTEYPYALTVWLCNTQERDVMKEAMERVLRDIGRYNIENNNPSCSGGNG